MPALTRRSLSAGLMILAATPAGAGEDPSLAAVEQRHGGRLGVFAFEPATGRSLAYRADQRVLMCSTWKALAVAAVLARVDQGRESLDRPITYGEADLLAYAPVARAHLADGALPVRALCEAAIGLSDNTAANLLLTSLGGPAAVTGFARSIGDGVTRVDRNEPAVNDPAGLLDTTTPRAMAQSLAAILLGNALSPPSRQVLEGWMVKTTTGANRLRAGLPAGWPVADKTGSGAAQTNDIALVRPPGRPPLVAAAFYASPGEDGPARERVLGDVGAVLARWAG